MTGAPRRVVLLGGCREERVMTESRETGGNGADVTAHAEAIRRAVREAVLTQARLGRPVVGWRDGRMIWLSPEEVLGEFGPKTEAAT